MLRLSEVEAWASRRYLDSFKAHGTLQKRVQKECKSLKAGTKAEKSSSRYSTTTGIMNSGQMRLLALGLSGDCLASCHLH